MKNQNQKFEHWFDAGRNMKMVRCSCWRHMAVMTKEGNFVANDNGWVSSDRVYPHASWCDARKA